MNTRPSPTPPATTRPKTSSSSITSSNAASSSQQASNMVPSSRPTRGATPSASRPASKAAEGDKPTRPSSKDSLKQKISKKPEEAPKPSKSDEQLKALKSDFDGLRSHLTCKICDRMLYQPYTISCGHTYCYSCLCTWFVSNKARKTCPDCRTVVDQLPAPAYVIRDMTTIFIARIELLPAGETIEEHKRWQKEEADAVQQDKDNQDPRTGGLFKGCFRASRQNAPSLRVVRDPEDGVDRCPMCSWELEDGECAQCGLTFDDNGDLTWGDSFTGFSDMDEMSERDMSGEDFDAEMDMEDGFDRYDDGAYGWQDDLGDEGSYMVRRFLEHGIPAAFMPRRRLTHSEAGSRRSYSQSIISDMYTDEMDTVEEEDEEGMDEDSSMNDFIEDDEGESSTSASGTSSTPGQTPQPSSARQRLQGRARRVIESEASSTISSVVEEEEEDEEDQGPIRRGQRNRAQTRILNRANGSREPGGPPSSTSTDVSGEQELDEDTQALLRADGWMLQHDGPDEEMDEEDDDDDSDGGRTTVGWDATAISNDRLRMGGSLTPTADRPRPNAPIRPPSRVGNPRFMDASRGLRRRSSVLSTSTDHYEDGEADNDDSDLDQDGDITMAMNSLRARRSRVQLRNPAVFGNSNANSRFANRGFSQGDAIDLDVDDHSDTSQPRNSRTTPRTRHPEYNPRISWMFADHQRALQEYQGGVTLLDLEARSTTPVARPRTANRNRPSPAQQYSPFVPPAPARLRTPLMDNSSNNAMAARGPASPPRRALPSPAIPTTATAHNVIGANRAPSVSSTSDTSVIFTPGTSTPTSQQSVNTISQAQAAAAIDMIDRPPSRVSARPPSASGRRTPGFPTVYAGFPHTNVGLNLQGRLLQNQRQGNPWGAFVQPHGVRPRNSRPVLRDQSSTATLRAVNSRANIRDGGNAQQGMRPQTSRINLRTQPSRRQLNNQASTRTLRASEHARPPQSPTAHTGATNQPAARPANRFTPDERDTLARELINNRMRALGSTQQAGMNPSRTNPFTAGFRRPSNPSEVPPTSITSNSPQHIRSSSNDSVNSMNSTNTVQTGPSSPVLGRRRSNRNIAATSPSVVSPIQGGFTSPPPAYTNTYFRARQVPLSGSNSAYDSPLNANARTPMVAASGRLI